MVQDDVRFVEWKPDAAGDIRALYRLHGDLWTFEQLRTLSQVLHSYNQEHEARLKERDERISELEKNTMQADTSLNQFVDQQTRDQAAIKRLETALKERNKRIKELENLLAATEEELKEFEAAIKRLEKQEMAA
jgi:septal ring factor EnvC (AmiA/AmiB activator)